MPKDEEKPATNAENFEAKFSQTDWIYSVQKVRYTENTNPYFHRGYNLYNEEKHCRDAFLWNRRVNAYTLELGYFS